MTEAVSYGYGSPTGLYGGRIELQVFAQERFTASYSHHEKLGRWEGRLAPGTFAKAYEALSSAGFPAVARIVERVPGEYPLELGWLRDGMWQHEKTLEWNAFSEFIILTSTILSVLDWNLARMPPGESTPVIEHHSVAP